MTRDVFDCIANLRKRGEPFALATVVATRGSVSAKTGSRAVIAPSGKVLAGWIGGGCAESAVCHAALECFAGGEGRILDLDLDDEVLGTGMPCGGAMRVFVEAIMPEPTLWILGHGRIAESLCRLAAAVGMRVVVLDDMAEAERYRDAAQLITDDVGYQALQPKPGDYVVVATQHKGDHQSMRRALSLEVDYIALIASKKRSRLVMDFLREEGFSEAALSRIYAPCGLDLGCRTPEEVALSVISEIVMLRRGGSGRPMREKLAAMAEKAA